MGDDSLPLTKLVASAPVKNNEEQEPGRFHSGLRYREEYVALVDDKNMYIVNLVTGEQVTCED